jgi:hypothetical protein
MIAMTGEEIVRNTELLAIAIFTFSTAWINLRTKDVTKKIKEVTDATHVIVNSQKTAMMEELRSSRLLTLGMANALLRQNPSSLDLKEAAITAQALYDKSVVDAAAKEKE